MCSAKEVHFSMVQDENMEELEKKIAYFFEVDDIEPVVNGYIQALHDLEALGADAPIELLEERLLPSLEAAYSSIKEQLNLPFDVAQAAKLELKMILAHTNGASFETISQGMEELYNVIFGLKDSIYVHKAALLRTFLYHYKVDTLKRQSDLSVGDAMLLVALAGYSEALLQSAQEQIER